MRGFIIYTVLFVFIGIGFTAPKDNTKSIFHQLTKQYGGNNRKIYALGISDSEGIRRCEGYDSNECGTMEYADAMARVVLSILANAEIESAVKISNEELGIGKETEFSSNYSLFSNIRGKLLSPESIEVIDQFYTKESIAISVVSADLDNAIFSPESEFYVKYAIEEIVSGTDAELNWNLQISAADRPFIWIWENDTQPSYKPTKKLIKAAEEISEHYTNNSGDLMNNWYAHKFPYQIKDQTLIYNRGLSMPIDISGLSGAYLSSSVQLVTQLSQYIGSQISFLPSSSIEEDDKGNIYRYKEERTDSNSRKIINGIQLNALFFDGQMFTLWGKVIDDVVGWRSKLQRLKAEFNGMKFSPDSLTTERNKKLLAFNTLQGDYEEYRDYTKRMKTVEKEKEKIQEEYEQDLVKLETEFNKKHEEFKTDINNYLISTATPIKFSAQLGSYNPDNEYFPIKIIQTGKEKRVDIPRDIARDFNENLKELKIVGTHKLNYDGSLDTSNIIILDPILKVAFPISELTNQISNEIVNGFNGTGRTSTVISVAFSPDGKYIVSGSYDRTLKLWDAQTGEEVKGFKGTGHTEAVMSVAFSPDGYYIVSGSYDYKLKLWDAQTGEEVNGFKGTGHTNYVSSVAFSPDGKYIVSGSVDKTLKLWDVKTGEEVKGFNGTGHTSGVTSVAFSPDGYYIVSGSVDKTLKLWDVKTGEEVKGFNGTGHTEAVMSVAFSPDGYYIVSGSSDKTLKLWDATTGEEVKGFNGTGHTSRVSSVAFSPDGKYIVSGNSDRTLKLWDANTGEEVKGFKGIGHTSSVNSVAFSPDGYYIVSGSLDKTLKLWKAKPNLLQETDWKKVSDIITIKKGTSSIQDETRRTSLEDEYKIWLESQGFNLDMREIVSGSKPDFPAVIHIDNLQFKEPSGNNKLDAFETAEIILDISNISDNPGNLEVKLVPLAGMELITFEKIHIVGEINGKETKSLAIPITAEKTILDGYADLRIEITEKYHNVQIIQDLQFITKTFHAPVFSIKKIMFDDALSLSSLNNGNGEIETSELIKVTLNIQNQGGNAEGVVAKLNLPSDEKFIYLRTMEKDASSFKKFNKKFNFGKLRRGDDENIEFYFTTRQDYDGEDFQITVNVTESFGEYDTSRVLDIPFHQEISEEKVIRFEGKEESLTAIGDIFGLEDIVVHNIPPGSNPLYPDAIAVIIGIENYNDLAPSQFKMMDAHWVERYFREVLGIKTIISIHNKEALRFKIMNVFEQGGSLSDQLKITGKPKDIFIYFGGHGFNIDGAPVLVPWEGVLDSPETLIYLEEDILQNLAQLDAGRIFCFIEACYSGRFEKDGEEQSLAAADINAPTPVAENPVHYSENMILITAADGKNVSSNSNKLQHGIFTYYLFDAFRGMADVDGNGKTTLREFYEYVAQSTSRWALDEKDRLQIPQIVPSPENLGKQGDWVIVEYK